MRHVDTDALIPDTLIPDALEKSNFYPAHGLQRKGAKPAYPPHIQKLLIFAMLTMAVVDTASLNQKLGFRFAHLNLALLYKAVEKLDEPLEAEIDAEATSFAHKWLWHEVVPIEESIRDTKSNTVSTHVTYIYIYIYICI